MDSCYKDPLFHIFMDNFNPFTDDPIIDFEYPATQLTFPIDSHGSVLNAIIEIAQGNGPHRTIILLHGFPGNEKNFDLAHVFRRAGFNVLVFYYRGSWGSGGKYSFDNCIQDVHTVIKYLRNEKNAKLLRVDNDNIILIGHSWGGFCALYAGLNDKSIHKIASISGFNPGIFGEYITSNSNIEQSDLHQIFNEINPLQGTSGKELLDEIVNHKDQWNLIKYGRDLSLKDLCITAAQRDLVLPKEIHHDPLIKSIKEFAEKNIVTFQYNTNHSYSDHRIALAKDLLKWLND